MSSGPRSSSVQSAGCGCASLACATTSVGKPHCWPATRWPPGLPQSALCRNCCRASKHRPWPRRNRFCRVIPARASVHSGRATCSARCWSTDWRHGCCWPVCSPGVGAEFAYRWICVARAMLHWPRPCRMTGHERSAGAAKHRPMRQSGANTPAPVRGLDRRSRSALNWKPQPLASRAWRPEPSGWAAPSIALAAKQPASHWSVIVRDRAS